MSLVVRDALHRDDVVRVCALRADARHDRHQHLFFYAVSYRIRI